MRSLIPSTYDCTSTPHIPSTPPHFTEFKPRKSLLTLARLKFKIRHIISTKMLCCSRKKNYRSHSRILGERVMGYPQYIQYPQNYQSTMPQQYRKAVHFPQAYYTDNHQIPENVMQPDFRKASGISSEIFRQIQAVERDYDPTFNYEAVEKRGEMIIRLLDPRSLGRAGIEAGRAYLTSAIDGSSVQFVEIVKRPGQTLGLYIREGDGFGISDGVFISRIALESPVYNSGLLKVGDEILAVNLVDVRRMSIDDVVIIMSIPRRLVLTIRSNKQISLDPCAFEDYRQPVVVVKKDFPEEESYCNNDVSSQRDSENGYLYQASHKGLNRATNKLDYYSQDGLYGSPHKSVHQDHWRKPYTVHSSQRFLRNKDNLHLSQMYRQKEGYSDLRNSAYSNRIQCHSGDQWADYDSRQDRLLRTESDNNLLPDYIDSYNSRGYKLSASSRNRSFDDRKDHRSFTNHDIFRPIDGSVSDTEFDAMSRSYYNHGRPQRYRRDFSGTHYRSNSLPRSRETKYDNGYLPSTLKRSIRGQVRFEKNGFSHLYDDDSDGAVSAPEFPETKGLLSRRNISGNMRHDYSHFSRAPSTSAIYDSIRRPLHLQGIPRGLSSSSLNRFAHSTESLLDLVRTDQKSMLDNPYANRSPNRSSLGRSYLLGINGDMPNESYQNHFRNRHRFAIDYRRAIPHPTPVKACEQERFNMLTLNPREFFKYRYEKPIETTKQGFNGLLWIHLLAGRGLRSEPPTYRDLYCVIESNGIHKARTVIRTCESSFDWDEIFEIDIMDIREVSFLLYSWDPQYRHKLCYKGIINLISLSIAETPVHSLALKMEPKGTLYIKIRYKDITTSFQRCPSPHVTSSSTAVFGVSLDTLVNRENSGLNIPLVLKRCVEEVEKRGIDIVGIYRLCGSAVRKKILREAFEKNSWLVDLNPEHVPDINVITNLIKDFLRELPEPLFTKALFDMMIDGLSVCLPDDATGNVKLMFSILECLPKINRCTVLYLMDHLKLVVSHSDRNKMCSRSMAVAFGPLFTCHPESESFKKPVEVFKFLLDLWPLRKGSTCRNENNETILNGSGFKKSINLSRKDKTSILSIVSKANKLGIAKFTSVPHSNVQLLDSKNYDGKLKRKSHRKIRENELISCESSLKMRPSHPQIHRYYGPEKSVAWTSATQFNE